MTTIATPQEWAADFISHGCDISHVDKELEACGLTQSDPTKAAQVRGEFIKQTIDNMEVSKRGQAQFKGWTRFSRG